MNRESNHVPSNNLKVFIAFFIAAAMFCGTTVQAALTYYEGFAYGPTDGSLAGANGGIGFSGPWTSGNPGITYSSVGLTFSDLSVSGGMVTATGTDGIGNAIFYRPLTSTLNGVYYGSFLSQIVNANSSAVELGMAIGPENSFPGTGSNSFGILVSGHGNGLIVNEGSSFQGNGDTVNQGENYLTLFKIDTIAKTIQAWLLSAAQYDNFKVGGITEDQLNAAQLGTGSSQLWARASVTGMDSITASYLNIYQDAFGGVSAALAEDEFRLSNTSLNEVTPAIPEPGSTLLLFVGLSVLGMTRKQKGAATLL